MVNSALQGCHIAVVAKLGNDATPQQVKQWVENCSGRVSSTITDQTTHVILGEKTWSAGGKVLDDIKQRRETNGQKIHIMKFQWLHDSCSKKRCLNERKREYSWERDEIETRKEAEQKYQKTKEPRSALGLVNQLFRSATDSFVDPREQKRLDARRAAEDAEKEQVEQARYQDYSNQETVKRRNEVAAVFKKGAQKARNELLSDNHHIYTDATGFAYDISVTKVDTRKNRNERYSITIYESNGERKTYAVNCQFGKTGAMPENNIIAVLGSNFETAFRAFKKVFKEKTRVDWDDRLTAAIGESRTQSQQVRFEDVPFSYHPPRYGPKGETVGMALPTATVPETGEMVYNEYKNECDIWERNSRKGPAPVKKNDGLGANSAKPYRLTSTEYKQNLARMERENAELGQVYDQPFSFGQSQDPEYMMSGGNGPAPVEDDSSNSDNDKMDSVLGKRKLTDDDTMEDVLPVKKARASTSSGEGGEDVYSGENQYNDLPSGNDLPPGETQYTGGEDEFPFDFDEPTGVQMQEELQRAFPSFEELIQSDNTHPA